MIRNYFAKKNSNNNNRKKGDGTSYIYHFIVLFWLKGGIRH